MHPTENIYIFAYTEFEIVQLAYLPKLFLVKHWEGLALAPMGPQHAALSRLLGCRAPLHHPRLPVEPPGSSAPWKPGHRNPREKSPTSPPSFSLFPTLGLDSSQDG